MIISSLIHGLVYAAIFKLFHHLSLAGAIIAAAVGVAVVWLAVALLRPQRG
jgi:hypothetical protein